VVSNDSEFITVEDAIKQSSAPVQSLVAGAERYSPLDESKDGSWRAILSNGKPVAVFWTDWETGFDIINLEYGEVATRLGNYVISSKAHGIPAGWAYTSLDTFIKNFDAEDGLSFSGQKNGKLSGAVKDTGGANPEPVDNGEKPNVTA